MQGERATPPVARERGREDEVGSQESSSSLIEQSDDGAADGGARRSE